MQWVELEHLIRDPLSVTKVQTERLGDILERYPYFTLAHILRLKGLRDMDSTLYEGALEKAALYSSDRTFLFDYIADRGLPPSGRAQKRTVAAESDLGESFPHRPDARYPFDEWLRLGRVHEMGSRARSNPANPGKGSNFEKTARVIDAFLTDRPEMSSLKRTALPTAHIACESSVQQADLMTETLARVYVEQKKYEQALKAYKILRLKYPEKSGYFADQIKSIKALMIR